MRIDEALRGVETLAGAASSVDVNYVQYDSRRVRPGDLFIAMRGGATDGNRFIATAIERGAAGIVTDSPEAFSSGAPVPIYLVEKGRRALAEIAANLLGHPERVLKVSAVTGTNGKTTTAWLLEQMLRSVGRKCVLIGTIETHVGDEVRASEHTTPEASDLLQIFADGVAAGCTEAVMEMSSHALDQERVWGIPVDVAIFTNLTQDHLDYHKSMGAYYSAKAKLFAGVGAKPPRIGIINYDDSIGPYLVSHAKRSGCLIDWGYSLKDPTNANHTFGVDELQIAAGKTTYIWKSHYGSVSIESQLTGKVNVYNLLAASCAALARGLSFDEIADAAPKLRQVPGRFQTVSNALGIAVVVDYAHTDDALRNLITVARELVGSGRVITLFGCGGDRDKTKRPKMGLAAGELSDLVILTSDNPRTEDPHQILDQALAGVRETNTECIVEPDRAAAIELAIRSAHKGDIVLLAGKGHEKVQILGDRTIPFDDVAVAAKVFQELA